MVLVKTWNDILENLQQIDFKKDGTNHVQGKGLLRRFVHIFNIVILIIVT